MGAPCLALAGQPVSGLAAAPLRRRTAARGQVVVDVKPGDAVVGVTQGWAGERFMKVEKKSKK